MLWKRNMVVVVRSLAPARPRVQQQVSVGVEGGGAQRNLVIYPTKERGREMNIQRWVISGSIGFGISVLASAAFAQSAPCSGLPSWAALKSALQAAVASSGNGGLGFNMWATVVAPDGTVCAVAFSGGQYTDQWLGSRIISAQKANTANAFSLSNGAAPLTSLFPTGLALSTANLYSAVQPLRRLRPAVYLANDRGKVHRPAFRSGTRQGVPDGAAPPKLVVE